MSDDPRSGDHGALESLSPRGLAMAAGVVLGVIVVCFVAYAAWVLPELGHPCGGDGGTPYAKPGTTAASVCSVHSKALSLLVFGPPCLLLFGVVVAITRGSRIPLAIGIAAAIASIAFSLLVLVYI